MGCRNCRIKYEETNPYKFPENKRISKEMKLLVSEIISEKDSLKQKLNKK